jgi:hypothetical protein
VYLFLFCCLLYPVAYFVLLCVWVLNIQTVCVWLELLLVIFKQLFCYCIFHQLLTVLFFTYLLLQEHR